MGGPHELELKVCKYTPNQPLTLTLILTRTETQTYLAGSAARFPMISVLWVHPDV